LNEDAVLDCTIVEPEPELLELACAPFPPLFPEPPDPPVVEVGEVVILAVFVEVRDPVAEADARLKDEEVDCAIPDLDAETELDGVELELDD